MGRKVFIDCGGHDGCSAVKFLLARPDYECFSFEPNSIFERYYKFIPTTLIKSAVSSYDGEVDFLIDSVDGDGSSIVASKVIDANGKVANDCCPSERVSCVNLCKFISGISHDVDRLVLKLDVEGAEYDILAKLMDSGVIGLVDEVYCEFHWMKMGMDRAEHEALLARLSDHVSVKAWDALPFAVYRRGWKSLLRRVWDLSRIFYMRSFKVIPASS